MADFCRLLARDNTPIVTRNPPPEYLLVRIQTCDYEEAPIRRPPVIVLPAIRPERPRELQDRRDMKAILAFLEKLYWR